MTRRGALRLFALSLLPLILSALRLGAAEKEEYVYFGTYTGAASKGIYLSRLDLERGTLSPPELGAESANPSFLALHPDNRHLYAVNEVDEFEGKKTGAVSSFEIDPKTGRLKVLNQVPSGGTGPCHLSVDISGRYLFVANYGGGSVAVLPIRTDGSLSPASSLVQHVGKGVNPERQEAPHAHEVLMDPLAKLVWVADLGLDSVLGYRFDPATGKLKTPPAAKASLAPGSGPRHLAFTKDGRFLFVLGEMALKVTAFRYDAENSSVTPEGERSTLPDAVKPETSFTAAEIEIHPSGRFLYTSNRGPDSLAVFSLDGVNGLGPQVEVVPAGGKTPRGFGIDPSGRYLLVGNQGSDTVVVMHIDATSGRLTPGQSVHVGMPVSVTFGPAVAR